MDRNVLEIISCGSSYGFHDAFCLCIAQVVVLLVPCEGSETYVNGKRVEDLIQLRSGT